MAKGKLIAEGTYEFSNNGKTIGRETWEISQLGHGGIVIAGRAEFDGERAFTRTFEYELDKGWSPIALNVRKDQGETRLSSTQRVEGDKWTARLEGPTDGASDYELPFSAKHEVDFDSPLFKTVTLLRLRLPVGSSQEIEAVRVDPASLVPSSDHQLFKNVVEEPVTVPAGTFPALRYEMTRPNSADGPMSHFSADHHGIVLTSESPEHQAQLIRYRRYQTR